MKHILFILLSFAIWSCTSKTENSNSGETLITEPDQSSKQQQPIAQLDTIAEEPTKEPIAEEPQVEDECIFNNDYRGLTTQWIEELKIESEFVWNNKQNRAEFFIEGDSIYLRKGGCYHSGNYAEISFINDTTSNTNFEYWKQKATDFAIDFGFEHSAKMLQNSQYKREPSGGYSYWLDIEDDDPNDITFYTGFEFNFKDGRKSISLDRYIN